MVADVIEGEPVRISIISHSQTDRVAGLGLQGAVLDIEHLVEELRDMETKGTLFWLDIVGIGAPGTGGECEFQLIAIVVDVFRTADGAHAGAVDTT